MKNPSTSASPPAATPRQLTIGFESIQLRLMNSAERAVVLTHLASILMLAAGVAPAEEHDHDGR